MAALFPEKGSRGHWWRFAVMTGLSVVVAVMGLSEDSGAVVIGAMLIAPLMTPILGVAASLAMAWPSRIRQSLAMTVLGTAGAVGVAWAITLLLPASDKVVTPEVLSRTSPDLRDLFIGLAAGAAGAYAVTREDLSTMLAGVAVAVALVPPLATVGFTLAIGRPDLANGAILLYLTNLVAIVMAATFVFLATGFVPSGRRQRAATGIKVGVVAVMAALAAVAVPLTSRSVLAAAHAATTQKVNEAALAWLSADPALRLGTVKIKGHDVSVQVIGPQEPPPSSSLLESLRGVVGLQAAVRVQWFQTSAPVAQAVSTPTTSSSLTVQEVLLLVHQWLSHGAGQGHGARVTQVSVGSANVGVSLTSPSAPPPAATLAALISKRVGHTVSASVNWTAPAAGTTTTSAAPSAMPITAGSRLER